MVEGKGARSVDAWDEARREDPGVEIPDEARALLRALDPGRARSYEP
jgi:hypothetical protein